MSDLQSPPPADLDNYPPLPSTPSTNLSFHPRHVDEETFRILNGEIDEPSCSVRQNVSDRVLTLLEWCDLMLSPDERRVACPGEIKSARQGRLDAMRSLWAERLAGEQSSASLSHNNPNSSNNPDSSSGSAEHTMFGQLLHAIKEMTLVYGLPCNEAQIDNDLATLGAPIPTLSNAQADADAHGSAATVLAQTNDALILQVQDFLSRTESIIVRADDVVHADSPGDHNAIVKVRDFLVKLGRNIVHRCRHEGADVEKGRKNKGRAVVGGQLQPADNSFPFNPEVTDFKPRCVPLNADMVANPANYHPCGCRKQTVVLCEYCNGDSVFCDPYR